MSAGASPLPGLVAAPAADAEGADGGAGGAAAENGNDVYIAPVERYISESSLKKGSLSGQGAHATARSKGYSVPFRPGDKGGPYVIIGHGNEELIPFDERPVVPEGYTLVTTILAGVGSTMPETCAMMDFLSKEENRPMVENPVAARFDIKRLLKDDIEQFQVYTAGQRMPKLSVKLLGNFSVSMKKERPDSTPEKPKFQTVYASKIFKSGVYQYPMPPFEDGGSISPRVKNITQNNIRAKNHGYKDEQKCLQFRKFFQDNRLELNDVQEIYKHSLHPTPEYLTDVLSTFTSEPPTVSVGGLGVALGDVPLTYLFEMHGPGVYYFIVCRASKDETNRDNAQIQNLIISLDQILNPDWIVYIDNDGVEHDGADPRTFYETFRISPYDLDYLRGVVASINDLLGRPIDDMVKKQAILSLLDDMPDSIKHAFRDKKYFQDNFYEDYIKFATESLARKAPLRRLSMQQQVRERPFVMHMKPVIRHNTRNNNAVVRRNNKGPGSVLSTRKRKRSCRRRKN